MYPNCLIEDERIAIEDVSLWLGFDNYNEYLRTLEREKEQIFLRASD